MKFSAERTLVQPIEPLCVGLSTIMHADFVAREYSW